MTSTIVRPLEASSWLVVSDRKVKTALGARFDAIARDAATSVLLDGVGDSENDLSWLSRIGHPVAVSNAVPAVKELAVLEIGHHDEEAVAELVEAVVAARTSSH